MDFRETAYWFSQILPTEPTIRPIGDYRIASATLADGRSLAATVDFARVDTGLALDDDPLVDVRCELMVTALVREPAAAAVALASAVALAEAAGTVPARPGILLPALAEHSGLAVAEPTLTVAHGLLMPPRLWGEQIPHAREEKRMTLMLEVVMLTDEEYGIGVDGGVDKLLRRMHRRGADLDDWRRE